MHLYLIGTKRKTLLYLNGARRRRVGTGLEHGATPGWVVGGDSVQSTTTVRDGIYNGV